MNKLNAEHGAPPREGMTREERLDAVNQLIAYIATRGRRFFYTNGTVDEANVDSVACMKLKNGRLYFVDNYTKTEIPMTPRSQWNGFSHGGTLRALVTDFAEFIRTGEETDGNNGYGGLHSSGWGHSDKIQREIIAFARTVGYLKRNDL